MSEFFNAPLQSSNLINTQELGARVEALEESLSIVANKYLVAMSAQKSEIEALQAKLNRFRLYIWADRIIACAAFASLIIYQYVHR